MKKVTATSRFRGGFGYVTTTSSGHITQRKPNCLLHNTPAHVCNKIKIPSKVCNLIVVPFIFIENVVF